MRCNVDVIDFKLTGRCNAKCDFCWDFCAGDHEAPLEVIRDSLSKLRPHFSVVSLTGGEPLLHREFDAVLTALRALDYRIYLSTNGYLLRRHIDSISESVAVVGLPVDSLDGEISRQMGRRRDMHTLTLRNMTLLRDRNKQTTIKVGTVATKLNANQLLELGEWLFSPAHPSPDLWRVYQFTPMGNANATIGKYELADNIFAELCSKLAERFGERVSFLASNDVEDSYIFVTPKLQLAIPTDDSYSVLADLSTVEPSILSSLMADQSQLFSNSRRIRSHLARALDS